MAILLHKMKLFSPFVKKYFSKSPQFISLSLFLTCLFINLPFIFALEVVSFWDYYYLDSDGLKLTGSFYYLISSEFSRTFFGQILLGLFTFFLDLFLSLIVGIILNISSYTKYKLHVRKSDKEMNWGDLEKYFFTKGLNSFILCNRIAIRKTSSKWNNKVERK